MSALAFRPSSRAFALIVLLIAASVLGLAPILVRLTETGPAAAGFWRFLFALPLLTILAAREPGGVGAPSKWALLAGLFFALDLSFWHYGIVMTSVANATVLCNLTPVVVTLFGWFVLKERPHRLFILALALAMGGAFAMAAGAGEAGVGSRLLGVDARHGLDRRDVAAEGGLQRVGDFTHRRLGAGGLNRQFQQVCVPARPLGQGVQPGLGGRVGEHVGGGPDRTAGADVDDRTAAVADHALPDQSRQPERPFEIQVHHGVEQLLGDRRQRLVQRRHPGIVDQNGRRTKAFGNTLQHLIDAGLIGHVQTQACTFDTIGLEIGIDLLGT